MGDIIHTLPAIASLKPGSHVTWAVEPRWAPLLAGNPYVDRVMPIDRSELVRSYRELRRERFDVAVDFQGLIKSALVAFAAEPDRTFGFDRTRETPAGVFYSDRVEACETHVVDRNLELAQAAGAPSLLHVFPLPPGEPEQPLPETDFVLACPLAGWASKQWPLEHYTRLAGRLRDRGVTLVVNGPPSSVDTLSQIGGAYPHLSGIPGLIYATRRAAAVVGVDSGPLHLAAALDKPGVAIFGPTDPARNGPYGNSLKVLRTAAAQTSYKRRGEIDTSMREITPDEVYDALLVS